MPKLTLIRGLPGSGKSTLAKTYDAYHVEADEYFIDFQGYYEFDAAKLGLAHKWCLNVATEWLKQGYDVVVSNTFTTMKELKPYLALDADITVVDVLTQYDTVHNVPIKTIDKMKARWVTYIPNVKRGYI